MIPVTREVEVLKSNTPKVKFKMEVSHRNMHLLIPLLRDSLYSNKKLAPLREYSTNAYDAHVEAGIPTQPIRVTLPTILEPELKIRDFGKGLSILEMSEIYFKYLESTKRESNDLNGMLGLGSKSAFAYADMFVVVSFKNGKKRIITCPISGEPTLDYEGDTDEENGVEICIPVKREDIETFVKEALNFYKYWTVRPVILGVQQSTLDSYFKPIDVKSIFFGEKWIIRPAGYGKDEAVCVMGNVPYPIDWDQVKSLLRGERATKLAQIWSFLGSNIVELRLPIGTIDFTPNREALQYTDHSLEGIATVLCEIYDRIFELITEKISKASNLWEAMIIYSQLFHGSSRVGSDIDKDSLFAGDMSAIKHMLDGRLKWNGIVVTAQFEDLHHWSETIGHLDQNHANYSYRRGATDPVFFTYNRGDSQTKGVKCVRSRRWRNSVITPSHQALVVVHDIEKSSCIGAAARYLLWEKHPNIHHIYFLRLGNKKVHGDFYKKYNFDSIPVINVSDIQDEVKAYTKRNRRPSDRSGSHQPISIPCADLDEHFSNKHRAIGWISSSIRLSDIKKGVFVLFERGDIVLGDGRTIEKHSVNHVLQAYVDYCKFFNIKPGKVYGIHRRTVQSKWFKEEIRCKNWVYLDTIVKKGMEQADKVAVQRAHAFFDQMADSNGGFIGTILAKKLIPTITDTNSPMMKYCNDISVGLWEARGLFSPARYFNLSGFDSDHKAYPFKTELVKLRRLYPLVFMVGNNSAIQNCDPTETYYKLSVDNFQAIVDYINSMDVYRTANEKKELTNKAA